MTYSTGPGFGSGKYPSGARNGLPRTNATSVDLREAHLRHLRRVGAERQPVVERRYYSVGALMDDGKKYYSEVQAPADLHLEDICARFARGTLIATDSGQVAIEDLQPGDMIRTRENRYHRLRWIGSCGLPADREGPQALRIKADALGDLRPTQDLIVSPHFRLLTVHPSCETLFGSPETLAPAEDLLDGSTILKVHSPEDMTFYNLMLDQHAIIEANGLATETYHPGNFGVAVMSNEMQSYLRQLLPHLNGDLNRFGRTARPILKGFEAEALRSL